MAVFVAMVMDMLDGKVARLTKTTSQFGVEFDSLADVVSFGVAPAFMVYSMALAPLGRAAWLGAFLFVICGALRLARFNVYTGIADRRYFVGLPIPAAAGMVGSVVLLVGGDELERWQAACHRRRHLPRVATHGLDLPLLELQGDRLRAPPPGGAPPPRGPRGADRGHPSAVVPVRPLHRLPPQRPHAPPVGAPPRGSRCRLEKAPRDAH